MKKVGIFSGTFDPVHSGHVSFALEAAKAAGLDKVFFLPEPRPRRKQGVKALERRVDMVKLATKGYDDLGVIVLNQARFTPHETLPVLRARFKGTKLFMLIGEDMLDHLADWPHIDDLAEGVSFIIGLRQKKPAEIKRLVQTIETTKGLRLSYMVFQAQNGGVASSLVRRTLRRGGTPNGLNPAVVGYIHQHQLYSKY